MANAYVLLALSIIISSFSVTSAATHEYEIDTVKQSFLFLVDDFGFKETQPHLELNISDIAFSDRNPNSFNLSQIGFFLSRNNLSTKPTNNISCYLHSPISSKLLYTFDHTNNTKIDLHFIDINGGVYYLYFENCIADKLNVSLIVRSSMYNLDPTTGSRCYLSSEKINFPMVYSLYLLIYSSCAIFWCYFLIYSKTKGCTVYRIHVFMLFVVILKALSIFLKLLNEYYISQTGCAQYPVYILLNYYNSIIMDETTLVILMVLIFTGWSFSKPYLRIWDVALLVLAVVGKVILSIYYFDWLRNNGFNINARHWHSGALAFSYVGYDLGVIYCAVASGVGFLHNAGEAHGKATFVLKKLKHFRVCFWVYFIYRVYIASLVSWFGTFPDTSKHVWQSLLLKELGEVFFLTFIGYWFRPQVNVVVVDDVEKGVCKSLVDDYVMCVGYVSGL